jgi:hydroxymethylbilane synthase
MSLPVSLRVAGRLIVIVGGGTVAARKAQTFVEAGARIRVVAPRICPSLQALLDEQSGESIARAYRTADLESAVIAVAATDDPSVNQRVAADAAAAGILVLDTTSADRSDVTMLATARIGDVTIAVDSGGSSPAFARRVARDIRERFGDDYGRAARILAHARTYVGALLEPEERAAVMRALSEMPIEMLAAMDPIAIEHECESATERLRHGDAEHARTGSVVCASRASTLAMTQTRAVAAKLAQRGIATTILNVTTTGDRVTDLPLVEIGAESLFVKELEAALRDKRADYAVHSCKDLPTQLPRDMKIVAISAREDPRDAFCSERYARFEDLPAGAIVGTSSLRRRAQLMALRPDLHYEDIRGNVDTRLRKLRDGGYDAIVLAMAGLSRLHASATHTVAFDVDEVVPAVAQGALAAETRADDERLGSELRAAINDDAAERAVLCERAALRALQGGCQAPIGIHARYRDGIMHAVGAVATLDGTTIVRAEVSAEANDAAEAEALGVRLAAQLLFLGADAIVAALPRPPVRPLAGLLIVLPRTQERPSQIGEALRGAGAEVFEVRAGDDLAALSGRRADVVIFPSSGSVAAARDYLTSLGGAAAPLIAAMGAASGAAAAAAGFVPDVTSPEATIEALVGAVQAHLEGWAP